MHIGSFKRSSRFNKGILALQAQANGMTDEAAVVEPRPSLTMNMEGIRERCQNR